MKKKPVVYAFIDYQNMRLSIVKHGWELDLKKFRIYLKDRFNVKKAFIFVGYIKKNENFYNLLKSFGYTLVFKPTVEQKGITKGNCDAELVLHTMIEYKNFDKGIIISGDGDFHCLLEYLKQKQKLLHLFIPYQYKFSSLLKEFGEYMIFMNQIRYAVEYKK